MPKERFTAPKVTGFTCPAGKAQKFRWASTTPGLGLRVTQVMGHKPSAIAEGYRLRSIDALRTYLATIEQFILDKAGITFDPATVVQRGLRVVSG